MTRRVAELESELDTDWRTFDPYDVAPTEAPLDLAITLSTRALASGSTDPRCALPWRNNAHQLYGETWPLPADRQRWLSAYNEGLYSRSSGGAGCTGKERPYFAQWRQRATLHDLPDVLPGIQPNLYIGLWNMRVTQGGAIWILGTVTLPADGDLLSLDQPVLFCPPHAGLLTDAQIETRATAERELTWWYRHTCFGRRISRATSSNAAERG